MEEMTWKEQQREMKRECSELAQGKMIHVSKYIIGYETIEVKNKITGEMEEVIKLDGNSNKIPIWSLGNTRTTPAKEIRRPHLLHNKGKRRRLAKANG